MTTFIGLCTSVFRSFVTEFFVFMFIHGVPQFATQIPRGRGLPLYARSLRSSITALFMRGTVQITTPSATTRTQCIRDTPMRSKWPYVLSTGAFGLREGRFTLISAATTCYARCFVSASNYSPTSSHATRMTPHPSCTYLKALRQHINRRFSG